MALIDNMILDIGKFYKTIIINLKILYNTKLHY